MEKNRPLSVLTGVRIRRVIFRENFVGTLEIVRTFQLYLDICDPLDMCE